MGQINSGENKSELQNIRKNNYISKFRKQYNELKNKYNEKLEEINELKKNMKLTKLNELKIQNKEAFNEFNKLKDLYNNLFEENKNNLEKIKKLSEIEIELNQKNLIILQLQESLKLSSSTNIKYENEIERLKKTISKLQNENKNYASGVGVDPVGGVEAIISHDISKKFMLPCAHSPAFSDYQIYSDVVSPKAASEYITPTFLPCILLGLSQAPLLTRECGISINDVDFLVIPYTSMGTPAVFGALENGVKVYAVKENQTALYVTPEYLGIEKNVKIVESYDECLNIICQSFLCNQ